MNKRHCKGCRNNIYNHGHLGKEECWHLKDAKLVMRKRVPVTLDPPWLIKPERLPDCYHAQGYAFLEGDAVR